MTSEAAIYNCARFGHGHFCGQALGQAQDEENAKLTMHLVEHMLGVEVLRHLKVTAGPPSTHSRDPITRATSDPRTQREPR